jgi:putative addiction module component (TIGR02574 family)
MASDALKLLEEALELPVEARAALVGSLLESLDDVVDEDVEQAWALEIARRLEEVQSGKVRPVPWAEARRRIVGE